MYERILVPVDLSQKAFAAVDTAYEMARRMGSSVTLLHVIETIEHVQFDEMKDLYARLESSAAKGLEELAARFAETNTPVEQTVIYGKRGSAIVNFAVENAYDLIILSSHRVDTDRPSATFATISYEVAILAPCPVLLVK